MTGGPLGCGLVTKDFVDCPKCLATADRTGALDFWWNWQIAPDTDMSEFNSDVVASVQKKFIPMVWGSAPPEDWSFVDTASYVMGFNEPDQFGPGCVGTWDPPAYGCAPGEDRQATSSGWANLFDPSTSFKGQPRAARYWQWLINNMTQLHAPSNGNWPKIVSPSMAQDAPPGEVSCMGVDPEQPGSIKFCHGWLKVFKEHTTQLQCTKFDGSTTNCWDIIDVIQIHAYARTAQDVKDKVQGYYNEFQEDFDGSRGQKKTLWITELAAASNDPNFIDTFVAEIFDGNNGFMNRRTYFYLEKVSWFSEFVFPSFAVGGYVPKPHEKWVSTLFDAYSSLSPVGKTLFNMCGANIGDGSFSSRRLWSAARALVL